MAVPTTHRYDSPLQRAVDRAIACSIVAVATALVAMFDSVAALPMIWLLGCAAVANLFAIPFLLSQKRSFQVGLHATTIALAIVTYFVPWNSRKAFLMDFRHVRPGMTFAEVDSIMGDYIHGTGWPTSADDSSELQLPKSIVYRHQQTGAYDSDWGIVRFENGRVVEATFDMD